MPRPARKSARPVSDDPLRDASRAGAIRIQKAMADAGVGSRRRCEELVEAGLVRVNGRLVEGLPAWVDPHHDRIEVDGQPTKRTRESSTGPSRRVYVMLYKPKNVVSTVSDPAGRRTAVELVQHPSGARLFPVGRLDYDSMGLLLLTNDGELANRLTHPRYGVHKTYWVTVKGAVTEETLERITKGVYLADRKAGRSPSAKRTSRIDVRLIRREPTRTIFEITLPEGRNRQVRRMFAKFDHPVRKLVRVSMGPLRLKGLRVSAWRDLTRDELQELRKAAAAVKEAPAQSPAPEPAP